MAHVIYLPGGPGGDISGYHSHYKKLLNDPLFSTTSVAVYTVLLRGMGPRDAINRDIKMASKLKYPMPLEDLSLKNAAMDVGALAWAIMNSKEWVIGDRISIF